MFEKKWLALRETGSSANLDQQAHPDKQKTEYAILSNEVNGTRKAPISDYCASLLAADIALELLDDELLFSDDRLDEIADGNHTAHFAGFDNRQMANTYLGHQGHTLFDILLRLCIGNTGRHDLMD